MNTKTAFSAALGAACLLASCASFAQGDAKRGEKAFDECRACHSTEAGVNAVGPTLRGVAGRKAGALEDFRYSPAIKRSDITWTRQTLDAFLEDPQKTIPANRMPYSGMPDAKNRADVVEYLQTLK
jgi:cytochrome c